MYHTLVLELACVALNGRPLVPDSAAEVGYGVLDGSDSDQSPASDTSLGSVPVVEKEMASPVADALDELMLLSLRVMLPHRVM